MNTTIARAMRFASVAAVFTCLLLQAVARFTWAHRREICDAAIAIYTACSLAAQWAWHRRSAVRAAAVATYEAGCLCRAELEALSARSAELVHSQPLPALAPILAPLAALREALERFVARFYPAVAG